MASEGRGRSLGELFQQRRAAAAGSSSQQTNNNSSNNNNINNFDRQNNRNQRNRSGSNDHSSRHSSGSRHNGGAGVGGGGGGGGGRRGRQGYADLPLEQGVVCSLKESFGFIHCADRPEEIFFHYSQLQGMHAADLHMDDEVEFRVGTSAKDADKLAAFQVRRLQPGTIAWETVEREHVQGLVADRGNVRPDRDGSIRILSEEAVRNHKETGAALTLELEGPEVKFKLDDYAPEQNSTGRLARGDWVEFTLVTDRRTKEQHARSIRLVQSERDRTRQEEEKRMLAEASLEHGVITSLKGDYGFLRSNKRREQVYFHYSSIELEDEGDENGSEKKGDSLVLKEGQDMKFLVVTEGEEGQLRRRVSARKVQMQPRGSVRFHDVLARGVTGIVIMVPQPQDSGHALDTQGKVRLSTPIKDFVPDENGNDRFVTEVYLSTKDSPGGSFAFRGGSSVGLWVEVGDILLFDVVKDFADGACRAVPTRHVDPCKDPTDLLSNGGEDDEDDDSGKAVRLIKLALVSRSEGIMNALKDSYGFIHFAERPVDVHFKLFQLLPDEIQKDLRRNMGLPDCDSHGKPLRLDVGSEVQFDISVHGSIQSHSTRQRGRQPNLTHERENLKAQRVLLLPPGTIVQSIVLAKNVRGVVTKDNPKQPYSGTIDMDEAVNPMTLEQRHPLVNQMIDEFLANEQETQLLFHDIQSLKEDEVIAEMIEHKCPGMLAVSHIPQPGEMLYAGRMCIKKVDAAERDAIAKTTEEDAGETTNEKHDHSEECTLGDADSEHEACSADGLDDKADKPHKKKKQPKATKPIKTIRYDKSNLVKELKDDVPPGIGDIVEFDVAQSRRTGQFLVENMRVIKRNSQETTSKETNETVQTSSGVGIVKEVVAARKFGFISVVDDAADSVEMLFFNLSSVASPSPNDSKKKPQAIRKGDEVKFEIGTDKTGKRVALNVSILPNGTLQSKVEKNCCRGLVLIEPSHTILKDNPGRPRSKLSQSNGKGGRWDTAEEDRKNSAAQSPMAEHGCILLVEDPTGAFLAPGNTATHSDAGSDAPSDQPVESGASKHGNSETSSHVPLFDHLHYQNSSIVCSNGSSNADESSKPRRGDLVSFLKTKKNDHGVRDVRLVQRGAATLCKGHLEKIRCPENGTGSATFVSSSGKSFDIELSEVVSCDASVLKENEPVEGLLFEGSIYGVCRTADLYLESKSANHSHSNSRERPKLNLTVRKDRGGTIMAQSMMAKGPDGDSNGFVPGWTKRMSAYVTPFIPHNVKDPSG